MTPKSLPAAARILTDDGFRGVRVFEGLNESGGDSHKRRELAASERNRTSHAEAWRPTPGAEKCVLEPPLTLRLRVMVLRVFWIGVGEFEAKSHKRTSVR